MTDFDPTTNRIPFRLLTTEEQAILKAWPHGWQIFDADSWEDRAAPTWLPDYVYRGKPVSVVKTSYYNVYPNGSVGSEYGSRQEVLDAVGSDSGGIFCVEFVDGKLKDVRVVKEDET